MAGNRCGRLSLETDSCQLTMQGGHCAVQGWTESLLSSLSLFLCFFTCVMGLDYIIATWLVVLCIVKAKHLSRIGKLAVSHLCICAVAVPSSSSWQRFQAAMKDNSDVHQRHSNVHTHTWVTVAVPLLLEKVIPQLQQGQLATPARLSAQKVQDLGTVNTLPLWSLFSEEVIRCSTTRCKSSVSRWKWISKVFTKVQLFCIVKISVATRLAWRGKFSLRIFASFVSQGGCRWIGYQ